ncbi:MAG: ABC transporter substrate-binding protein [Spirochaetaceae bacterium]|jgi:ABC-type nitrate/sulfonate/bicarbonate transport system substrate-binding protein|nr:ABC transporter substrate-binding protein [Spirochaetaceae bacterium]
MMRRSGTRVLMILVGLAALVSACGGGKSSSGSARAASTPGGLIPIRTNTKLTCTATPYVVADKKGFFAEEGLVIEYTGELGEGQTLLPTILNGTNDIGESHPNALATYINEGAEVRAVTLNIVDPPADVDPKFRHMRFYVSPKSGIRSLADLRAYKAGGTITISGRAPSCNTFLANNIFSNNGLDKGRIEYVAVASDTAALQAVEQGNLDIAFIHPPFYYLAEQTGLLQIADSYDAGLGAAAGTYVYYFSNDFIETNPELVQRFVNAIKKAQRWANENPDEAMALTAAHISKEVNAVHFYYTGDGFPAEYIEPWILDLESEGALERGAITVEDLVTFEFEPRGGSGA